MLLLNDEPVDIVRYPNGETLLRKREALAWVANPQVTLVYEDDSDLFHLQILAKNIYTPSAELTIPYMPYSRADRSQDGSIFTLRDVCDIINGLGFAKVTVYEAHSDVTLALLDKCTNVEATRALYPLVMNDICLHPGLDWIVFPDAGAGKRYFGLGSDSNFPVLFGDKVREFATGRIESLQFPMVQPRKGAEALIVDDLCSYGGTFVMAAEALRELGFSRVYLLVTHLEQAGYNDRLFKAMDGIYASDSIPAPKNYTGLKVTIYPLEGITV